MESPGSRLLTDGEKCSLSLSHTHIYMHACTTYTCMNDQQTTSLGCCETEGVWLVRLMNHIFPLKRQA